MSKKSKVAYRDGTQTTSDDMPKIQNTLQRKGVYYYNARNPQDLVEAGLLKSHWKKSLGTKNYSEAKRLAALETLAHATEIESLRNKQLEEPGLKAEHALSTASPRRQFSALSQRDQRTLVLEYFVGLERQHEAIANTFSKTRNDDEKELILDNAVTDFSVYVEGGAYQQINW